MTNKYQYVISLFRKIYGLNASNIDIAYGLNGTSKIQIREGRTAYFKERTALDLSLVRWKSWRGRRIPFFFDEEDNDILVMEGDQVIVNFDVIAGSFFFLSGWQEYVCPWRDKFGRFPFAHSLQHKLNLTEKPVVNYYFDILKKAVEMAYGFEPASNLWAKYEFAACLSHDIDNCQSAWRRLSLSALMEGKLWTPIQLMGLKLLAHDEWFNIDEILAIEASANATSSFFFMGQSEAHNLVANADYDVTSLKLRKLLQRVRDAGSEVGVHGSYRTHDDLEAFRKDMTALGNGAHGNRFHLLAFDVENTPHMLDLAGMIYDCTLGFAEHIGFRNGFCFPFYLYDIAYDKELNVLEVPLHIMDTSLQAQLYMDLKPERVVQRIRQVLDEVQRFHGVLSVLWHNTHFSEFQYRGWRKIYIDLLDLFNKENALVTNTSKIVEEFLNE